MGKRSDFERVEKDFYRTFDPKAIMALRSFIDPSDKFIEPCAGDGILVKQLQDLGLELAGAFDTDPRAEYIKKKDALTLDKADMNNADIICTNPPWSRNILHPMIEHFANLRPTWLLFDSDWAFTKQSRELLQKYCTDIVAVGRLKWIEGSKMSGKDNCSWYKFTNQKISGINFHNHE